MGTSSEETSGGFLDGSRVATGHQKDQVMIRSMELYALAPILGRGGGEEGLEIESIIDHTHVMKPP